LARSATGLIGLVVPDIADPYFSTIAAGVQQAADAKHRQIMLAATQRHPEQELAAVRTFIAHRTDAILLVGSRWSTPEAAAAAVRLESCLARYVHNGGRVAVIGQHPTSGAHAVLPRNRDGAAAMAKALMTSGLQDYVLLSGPRNLMTARERTNGFLAALAKGGLQPRDVIESAFTRDGGYAATTEAIGRLSLRSNPACLFATADVMAIGAMAALRDAGLRIPADVQVAGFDDIPTLRDHHPGLTTVRLPMHSMGRKVVQLALESTANIPTTVRVSGTVILRDTTRPKDFENTTDAPVSGTVSERER
jgi:LacI family transcriptional regulator